MRVSSLSDRRIIEQVSRYFVPAWISRDHYQLEKPDRHEQDLLARIDASRHRKRLEGGAVCVYIATGSGEVLATLPVQKASKPELLLPFLRKLAADHKLKPRQPADVKSGAAPRPVKPRPTTRGGQLFTVRTRFDEGPENRGTSRDVVELTKAEWSKLVAPEKARRGTAWKVPRAVAEKLLRQAYPPLPHWNAKLARVITCELTATVSAVKANEARLRLEGKLELVYPDRGEPTDGRVTARLVGVARCDPGRGTLTQLQLTSDGARYVWSWQGKLQPRAMSLAVELGP